MQQSAAVLKFVSLSAHSVNNPNMIANFKSSLKSNTSAYRTIGLETENPLFDILHVYVV